MTYQLAPVFKRWNGYHCEAIEREHYYAVPCTEMAVRVYRDADGVAHPYGPQHLSLGIIEAHRRGWTLDLGVSEAAA